MLVYVNVYSSKGENNAFHNMQFTVKAYDTAQAIKKAERVAHAYNSGYEVHTIECTVKPSVHSISDIVCYHMTVGKRVYGMLYARIANVVGSGWMYGSETSLT